MSADPQLVVAWSTDKANFGTPSDALTSSCRLADAPPRYAPAISAVEVLFLLLVGFALARL